MLPSSATCWKEGLMISHYLAASEIVQKLKAEILGASAVEYALIAAGVGLAILAAVGLLGDELAAFFNDLNDLVEDTRCVEVGSNCKK